MSDLVGWMSLLVFCIYGWLSYIQRRENGNRPHIMNNYHIIHMNHYYQQKSYQSSNIAVTQQKKKTPKSISYDDPKRDVSLW